MRIRRSLPILLGVVLVAAALAIVVVLRKHAPPEPARLLPTADGFLYVNFKWIRRANIVGQLPTVSHDPDYQQFIEETGFQWERDLDQAAFAIHYASSLPGARPAKSSEQTHYSEVFVGKIDGERLRAYLRKLSTSVEDYRSTDIYSIPLEGRTLRVAILTVDTVAASNHPDAQLIRDMIDRSRKLASPFGGPPLLRRYHKEVPFASLGWAIFRVDAPETPSPAGPFGLSFLFSKPAIVVASARWYLGAIHLRAESLTDSEEEARQVTERTNTFLNIIHSAEVTVSGRGPDPDVTQFLDSLKVKQDKHRVVLTASLPSAVIKKVMTEAPPEQVAEPPNAPSTPTPKGTQVQ